MREIKFRAWDEGNKVMHHDFQFFTSGENANDWICFSSDKEERHTNHLSGIFFSNPYFRKQLKIMQFTGLKDKNGKEIYEGDVLSFVDVEHPRFEKPFKPFVVFWNEKEARFTDWSPRNDVGIIGNLYENPELVKEVK